MVASLKLRRANQQARRKFGPALTAAREARGFGQVQDWLESAEPATDDCPLFDQERRTDAPE